jgi:hypothetical protein
MPIPSILDDSTDRVQLKTLLADLLQSGSYTKFSVATRHRDLDQEAIWSIGEDVARKRERRLYGRAVNQASTYMEQKLKVLPAPLIPENPNHANVTGWPPDKEAQKMLAILIAEESEYMPR